MTHIEPGKSNLLLLDGYLINLAITLQAGREVRPRDGPNEIGDRV